MAFCTDEQNIWQAVLASAMKMFAFVRPVVTNSVHFTRMLNDEVPLRIADREIHQVEWHDGSRKVSGSITECESGM